jgi:acetylglutamate kinase
MPIVHTEKGPGPELDGDDAAVFEQARALLKSHPALHLSITSPLSLLEELFTVKGSGTVVRPGSVIETIASAEAVDTRRLGGLLEDAFGRPLKDPKGWRSADVIYLESEYRGAALVQRCEIGDYLAKFAVGAEARGLGLAQELWTEVTANHPRLYWRARRNNPIVPWYKQQADGRHLVEGWIIFWRGIPVADIVHVIADGLARPSDFVEDD